MTLDPKRVRKIVKKRAEKKTAEEKGAPKKQSSGSEAFDKAIDLMLNAKYPKK